MQRIILRKWQEDARQEAIETFSPEKKLFLTHATPGGGKTIHGLSVADALFNIGKITHIIILAPSTTLVDQWQTDAKTNYGFELKNSILYNGMPDFDEFNGMVMTYQAMNESHESLRIFCNLNNVLIIADEIHHVADGQSWGSSFRNAFELSENILALTGTPWASEGKVIPYITYGSDGYAEPDYSYNKSTAIKDSVCRITEFYPSPATDLIFIDDETGEVVSEHDTLQEAIDEDIPGAYRKTLCSLKHMKVIFKQADEQLSVIRDNGINDAGGLIVAPSIKAAHKFQDEIFMLTGNEYTIVHSKSVRSHERIKEFKTSRERWLISVDMVTEGVDIKRLQVCVFLSSKNTELFLRQVVGRIERVRNPDSIIDGTGMFYYTDIEAINNIVEQLESENKAGLELKEQNEPDEDSKRKKKFTEDNIVLEDVNTEQAGLIAKGHHFSDDVVAEAIKRKRGSMLLADVPLFIVCKVIMAEVQEVHNQPTYEEQLNVPLTEKKSRIRSRISKEINRKLYSHLSRQASSDEIRRAQGTINKRVGMQKTTDSTSMEMFEKKLEYVTISKAGSWLC